MGKIITRLIFILSISINIAFGINIFMTNGKSDQQKQLPLNLTDTQKSQLEKIRLKNHQKNEHMKKKISAYQERMIAALHSETVDREEINHCIDGISAIQKEIQQNTINEILQIKKHLDPQQCNCLVDNINTQMKQGSKPCTMECCKPKSNGDK